VKRELKGFVIGVILTTMLMSTAVGGSILESIEVRMNSVNLTVNGEKVEADNILYEGTTMYHLGL